MGDVAVGKALAVNAPGQQRPYLRTKNVFDGRIDLDDVLTMPMTDPEFARFTIQAGDVLLNEGQSLELVGRCAIYQDEYPLPCAMQNQLLRFRARRGVWADFAHHLFRYCQQSGVFAQIALQTTSIAHLGARRFGRLPLLWPETECEQQAIAEALSDADAQINALDQLIAKKRDINQGVIDELMAPRARLPGFSGDWATARLGEIARLQVGRTPSRQVPVYWGAGHPWLSIADLVGKYVSQTSEQITAAALPQMSLIPAGTLVMSFKLSLGKLAFTTQPMYSNEAICALLDIRGDAAFMYYALGRTDFSRFGQQAVKGLTLNRDGLNLIEVPYPRIDEQRAIAAVLSDMDAEIAALERQRDKMRLIKQGMMQQLLTGRIRLT